MHIATLVIALLDAIVWTTVAGGVLLSQPEPATCGLDLAAVTIVSILFALTGAPALILVWRKRAARAAFALSLAFPGIFVVMIVAVALTLP